MTTNTNNKKSGQCRVARIYNMAVEEEDI